MDISEIDSNFKIERHFSKGKPIAVPSKDVCLFGLLYDEANGFTRMKQEIADQVNDGVKYLNKHTSGGRVGFSTNSKNIAVHVRYDSLDVMYHMAPAGSSGMSLSEYVEKEERHIFTFRFDLADKTGYCSAMPERKETKNHDYLLYFPLYNRVKSLFIEIDEDASIAPFNPYKKILPILYYGSSITQGGCASRSDHSYQGFLSKWLHTDFVNLGFSGSCKAENVMVQYLSSLECSVFVYDYDHNTPDEKYLKETHEPLFLAFRKTHPNTPVIFMSAPSFYYAIFDLKKRRKAVKETYRNAKKNGDKNVYFIDGATLFPKEIRYDAAVDGTHPTDLGFYFMAKKLYKILVKLV